MARNPELTRQLLTDAAVAEFSAHGLAGARVDRIAEASGVNKERIYQYFGSKVGMFTEVLEQRLTAATDAIRPNGVGEEAALAYALELARFHEADPTLARLLHWEALELAEPVALEKRRDEIRTKVDALASTLPQLDRDAAAALLHEILLVANASTVLTNLAASIYDDPGRGARVDVVFGRLIRAAVDAAE